MFLVKAATLTLVLTLGYQVLRYSSTSSSYRCCLCCVGSGCSSSSAGEVNRYATSTDCHIYYPSQCPAIGSPGTNYVSSCPLTPLATILLCVIFGGGCLFWVAWYYWRRSYRRGVVAATTVNTVNMATMGTTGVMTTGGMMTTNGMMMAPAAKSFMVTCTNCNNVFPVNLTLPSPGMPFPDYYNCNCVTCGYVYQVTMFEGQREGANAQSTDGTHSITVASAPQQPMQQQQPYGNTGMGMGMGMGTQVMMPPGANFDPSKPPPAYGQQPMYPAPAYGQTQPYGQQQPMYGQSNTMNG